MFASLLSRRDRAIAGLRLGIEILEARDCPSSLILDTQVLPGHEIHLSGSVIGDFTPGSTISFSGAVAGECEVDSSGQYSFTTIWGSLGDVTAIGMFGDDAFTDPVTNVVITPAPVITLSIADMNATTVTFAGTVTGVDVANLDIPIPGSPRCATTDAQGDFSFTMPRQNLGMVEVSVTDFWGQTSNVAQVNMATAPPFIVLTAVQNPSQNTWTFEGWVYGNNVQGLTVTFGGIDGLQGAQASVDENGFYTFTKIFDSDPFGTVTAVTMQDGISSNTAYWTL